MNGQSYIRETFGLKMKKYKESEYYKELKLKWRRDYWTWERIHKLGRNSSDAGVRMECERLAVKIVKHIPLIENDVRFLNRMDDPGYVVDNRFI